MLQRRHLRRRRPLGRRGPLSPPSHRRPQPIRPGFLERDPARIPRRNPPRKNPGSAWANPFRLAHFNRPSRSGSKERSNRRSRSGAAGTGMTDPGSEPCPAHLSLKCDFGCVAPSEPRRSPRYLSWLRRMEHITVSYVLKTRPERSSNL